MSLSVEAVVVVYFVHICRWLPSFHTVTEALFDGKLNLTMWTCVSTTHFPDSDKMDGIGCWNAWLIFMKAFNLSMSTCMHGCVSFSTSLLTGMCSSSAAYWCWLGKWNTSVCRVVQQTVLSVSFMPCCLKSMPHCDLRKRVAMCNNPIQSGYLLLAVEPLV